jgi:hypothetical protein
MRRISIAAIVFLMASTIYAQWQPNDPAQTSTIYYNGGNVGIGTSSPLGRFHVQSPSLDAHFRSTPGVTTGYARLFVNNDAGRGATFYSYGSAFPGNYFASVPYADLNLLVGYSLNAFVIGTNSAVPLIFGTGPGPVERVRIAANGNVGIGTTTPTSKLHVVGDANFTGTVTGGNIQAKYQDIAEWVEVGHDLAPGTVVVLDSERSNAVQASATPYDSAVAGVISAQPGLILGEGGTGKEMVATTGRVRVRVDATSDPIRIGDLLVTGSKAGTAIRSKPVLIEGQPFHRPGTIIGKALEPLASGEGEILVLLSLQ